MKTTQLFFVMSFCFIFAASSFAQVDTVCVPANLENGDPYVNSLIDYVVADTNAAGEQLHTVYKLERGKFYLLNKTVDLRNPVELVADPPIPNDPVVTPPKILSDINEDGGTATNSLIITWADITIKNIWLVGTDMGGVNHGWGTCAALLVNDSLVTVTLDGVWADYNGWCSFGTYMPHTRWHINNFHARNEIHDGDQWCIFFSTWKVHQWSILLL